MSFKSNQIESNQNLFSTKHGLQPFLVPLFPSVIIKLPPFAAPHPGSVTDQFFNQIKKITEGEIFLKIFSPT